MHFGKVIYRQTKTFVRGEGAKGEKGEDVRLEMANKYLEACAFLTFLNI